MPNPTLARFQIGKNGLTEGVISSLALALKNHKQVRISMLKSSGRDRKKMQDIALELKSKLPYSLGTRIIGFTIILIKLGNKAHK